MKKHVQLSPQYRDALLEYLALTQLEDDLRGTSVDELRHAVTSRKCHARDVVSEMLLKGKI